MQHALNFSVDVFDDEEGEEYGASGFGSFGDYFRHKKLKLQNLDADIRSSSPNNPPIFRGVVAYVNGYTQPSLNDLHRIIVSHGGGFLQYLEGKTAVTHIIAGSLTPKKKEEFRRYRIVKPAWVVDSVKAGRLLPWNEYRVVDEGPGQKVLGVGGDGRVVSESQKKDRGYREQTDASWYTAQLDPSAEDGKRTTSQSISRADGSRPPPVNSSNTKVASNPKDESFGSFGIDDFDEIISDVNDGIDQNEDPKGEPVTTIPRIPAMIKTPSPASTARTFAATASAPPEAKGTTSSGFATDDFDAILSDDGMDQKGKDLERPSSPTPGISAGKRLQSPTPGSSSDTGETKIPRNTTETPTSHINDEFDTIISDGDDQSGQNVDSKGRSIPTPAVAASAKFESRASKTGPDTSKMTPEESNEHLLSNPQMRNSSVVNPDFIQQFYRESRLHHLSTWKSELKAQLQGATRERCSTRQSLKRRAPDTRRYILHVDFDSFFAAVSIKQHPELELEDKPVAVAHGTGPGSEIASCNYPARKFGVRNGSWMKGALELCPDLKVLPYDFQAYEEASKKFYEAVLDTEGIVQSVSIDEALVDVTTQCIEAGGSDGRGISEGSIYREQDMADSIAQGLRDSIKEKTGCNVSVGIGGNVLQAKLALRKAKPAGQFQLKPEAALDFIGGLTVRDLPGVAYSLGAKLEELGVTFVKDIRELTKERLITHLGPKTGAKLWDYSRGVDNTEVGDQGVRKSVSAEINWGIRFVSQAQADEFVQNLCEELQRRLVENAVKGKQLTMRIMRRAADAPLEPPKHLGHGKCDIFNRSVTLGVATNASDIIGREAVSMLRSFKITPGDLRGIGVQMTKLEPVKQIGELESSQRQLQFKPSTPSAKRIQRLDPDEIDSPKKADVSARINIAPLLNDASQKPLNLTGTQFIMPTQVDPSVLAELPQDIRSHLVAKPKQQATEPPGISSPGRGVTPRTQSPSPFVPPQSQLDPETLEALPEDVRAEVLAYYEQQQPPRNPTPQPPPESPRRNPPAPRPRTTPTKSRTARKRGRTAAPTKSTGSSRLVQSNFVFPSPSGPSTAPITTSTTSTSTSPLDEEISPEFLAALPEDIRQEVLDEHRRTRLQKRAGLAIPQTTRRKPAPARPPPRPRTLVLPPRPEKPTFTTRGLSTAEEVRSAVEDWVEAFKGEDTGEGPFVEDVKALAGYLTRVVMEERDIAKAVDVCRWFAWLVADEVEVDAEKDEGQEGDEQEDARTSWKKALDIVRAEISAAVKERGLPAVDFT